MILFIQLGMTAATVLFAVGLWHRHRNNALHRKLMATGMGVFLSTAVGLVAWVNLAGATYAPAPWLVELAGGEPQARRVLTAHRGLATLAFIWMALTAHAGAKRLPRHKQMAPWAVVLWLAAYGSGLVIFQ
ncbi:MAG: DUF420 domain-containing protein [Deltaproteobacteria bacterium]|nr:DUF420 domain-containing protein [Deltaproteobacteria bacterium]